MNNEVNASGGFRGFDDDQDRGRGEIPRQMNAVFECMKQHMARAFGSFRGEKNRRKIL